MSGYSYSGGPWPPPQLPQQPPAQQMTRYPQYDYQIPTHQQPPAYGTNAYQTMPPHLPPSQDYFAASQAAFNYNSNVIPGLGIATPSPGHEGLIAPPATDWYQPPPTAPAEPQHPQRSHEPPALPQYAATGSFLEQFRNEQSPVADQTFYSPPPAADSAKSRDSLHRLPPHSAANEIENGREEGELEEGELSEDESDDVYIPTATIQANLKPNAPHLNGASEEASKQMSLEPSVALRQGAMEVPSRDASVIDLQEDAFYDEDGDESGEIKSAASDADADDEDMAFSDSEQKTTPPVQERGVSYSPRLSPGEIDEDAGDSVNGSASKLITNGTSARQGQEAAPSTAGIATASEPIASTEVQQPRGTGEDLPNGSHFATVDDAKKEAQRAILKLIPYGVSYQTYIDEGFDEKTIRVLFTELGLKAASTPTADSPAAQPAETVEKTAETTPSKEPGNKQEERKDRIARLLAMKASKPAPAKQSPPKASGTVSKTAKPEKTKSEKERLLQQKLEALRWKQEQRLAAPVLTQSPSGDVRGNVIPGAQLPVPEDQVVPSKSGQTPQIPVKTPPPSTSDLHVSSTPQTSTPPSLQPSSSLPPRPTRTSQAPPLPVALLPPKPHSGTQSTAGPRKRPVAADFDDTSGVSPNPLKRPFGQMRHDSSLVIDVSDDSDDDVEMEVDSQTDEPLNKRSQTGKSARNGPSFRDYPPLSESPFSIRQFGRQANISTPPNGPAGGSTKAKDDEYARKMRQIEEMKRKIAEAEAKKSRGSRAGTQSPKDGDGTPPDVDVAPKTPSRRVVSTGDASEAGVFFAAVSARLPKPSDGSSRTMRENRRALRDRIASQQLPKVEAGLKEKMFKLKLFQDKIVALQAEINAGMAEKQRLAQEMDELAHDTSETSPPPEAAQPAPEVDTSADSVDALIHAVVAEAAVTRHSDTMDSEATIIPTTASQNEDGIPPANALTEAPVLPNASVLASEEPTPILNMSPLDHDSTGDEKDPATEADSDHEVNMLGDESLMENALDDESGNKEDESDQSVESAYEPSPGEDEEEDIVMEDAAVSEEEPITRPSEAVASQSGVNAGTAPTAAPTSAPKTTSSTFVPYESPLQYFRSYRFHPQYRKEVKGGLKSLTYSGSINPEIALCPRELDGHACTDESCPCQHMVSMVPQDDKILVELGRSDDFTGDRKSKFVDGLREVLKRFRDAKIRDFDKIAYEIIDFRRKFLGDDSRILSHLEDVTI